MNNEPVAWINKTTFQYLTELGYSAKVYPKRSDGDIPLYTHPHSEESVKVKELTDEEIMKTCIKHGIYDCISDSHIKDDGTNSLDEDLIRFARAIEAKVRGEK